MISLNKNKIGEEITGQKRNTDEMKDENAQVSCRCKVASKLILSFVLGNERYYEMTAWSWLSGEARRSDNSWPDLASQDTFISSTPDGNSHQM